MSGQGKPAFRRIAGGAVFLVGLSASAQAFDLQGHRGTRGLMPENTLPAFAKALAIGVDTLELDTGVTRDGVVVVSHNPHLEGNLARGPNGMWLDGQGPALRELTLAELKTYDLGRLKPGNKYQRQFPEQTSVDGTRMPTLAEVFDLVRHAGNTTVQFNIETKIRPSEPDLTLAPEPFVASLLEVINKNGVASRVTLQSFDWRTLKIVQRLAPSMPTSCLTAQQSWLDNVEAGKPGPSPWTAGLDVDDFKGSVPDLVHAASCRIWSPYHKDISAESVARAHALGLQVKTWTVNDPARMGQLIDMAVDGIITDYPNRLREVMAKRGMPMPPQTPVQ